MVTAPNNLHFDPERHTYSVAGRPLRSVTEVVGSLKPAFDSRKFSALVAKRDRTTPAAVLAQWDRKRQDACDKGHELHGAICSTLTRNKVVLNGLATTEFAAWESWWRKARESLKPVMVEQIVADLELGIAGTLDAGFQSAKTERLHVLDWKQGCKFRVSNQYGEKLLPPFQDLDNSELEVYSLQVSLYRLMLERQGHPCGDGWILYLNKIAVPYRARDYRVRLDKWLRSSGVRGLRTERERSTITA